MIVVTKIEILKTEKDYHEIMSDMNSNGLMMNPSNPDELQLTIEMIRGRTFRNPVNNEFIVIGWTLDVQEALSIPFELFEQMDKQIVKLNDEINTIHKEINTIRKFGIVEHIKYWWKNK